jgi:hypothetical protein
MSVLTAMMTCPPGASSQTSPRSGTTDLGYHFSVVVPVSADSMSALVHRSTLSSFLLISSFRGSRKQRRLSLFHPSSFHPIRSSPRSDRSDLTGFTVSREVGERQYDQARKGLPGLSRRLHFVLLSTYKKGVNMPFVEKLPGIPRPDKMLGGPFHRLRFEVPGSHRLPVQPVAGVTSALQSDPVTHYRNGSNCFSSLLKVRP